MQSLKHKKARVGYLDKITGHWLRRVQNMEKDEKVTIQLQLHADRISVTREHERFSPHNTIVRLY